MKINLEIKKKIASDKFELLQTEICQEFEKLRKKIKKESNQKFNKTIWKKSDNPKDGGGQYFLMRDGEVFDSWYKLLLVYQENLIKNLDHKF